MVHYAQEAILSFSKARLHRRFLSQQLNAIFVAPAEVVTSCDFIAILMQFVNVNVSTRLLLKKKSCVPAKR